MQISWNGLSSFIFTGKPLQGEVSLITDPYQNSVGLRFPRTLEGVALVQSSDSDAANNKEMVSNEGKKPFFIHHAGEYEVQGIFIKGIQAKKKNGQDHTIYRFIIENISIAFLGSLDRKLKNSEIEALGDIDILIVPVGGGNVLDKDESSEVVSQVEPRMVIPSYFHIDGMKEKIDNVEAFCKELACPREDINKMKISKSALPQDEIQIRVLSRG